MKNTTINLPGVYVSFIQDLVDTDEKSYPSRSEAIRGCLTTFVQEELKFFKSLGNGKETMKINTLNLPESVLEDIEGLVGPNGLYPSRSELIRCAIRDFLLKKLLASQDPEQDEPEFEDFEDFDEENYVRIPIEKRDKNDDPQSLFKTYKILRRLA